MACQPQVLSKENVYSTSAWDADWAPLCNFYCRVPG